MSQIAVTEPGSRLQNFLDRAGLSGFPWKSAIILYTISWGWLFIVRDSLWADDFFYLVFDFRIQGFAPWLDIQYEAIEHLGLTFFRSVIFVSFLFSSIFLFGIARRISFLNLLQCRAIVLISLLLPFNTTRVAVMVYLCTIGYLFFFLAWYLVVTFSTRKVHFLSVGLFFISFQFHSLLVFYVLPVLHLLLLSETKNLRGLIFWLRKNSLLVPLPLVYWISRSIFWPERVAYHDVSVSRTASALPFVVVSLIVVGGLWLLHTKVRIENKSAVKILLSGFVATCAGLGAYVVLGFFSGRLVNFSKIFFNLVR